MLFRRNAGGLQACFHPNICTAEQFLCSAVGLTKQGEEGGERRAGRWTEHERRIKND